MSYQCAIHCLQDYDPLQILRGSLSTGLLSTDYGKSVGLVMFSLLLRVLHAGTKLNTNPFVTHSSPVRPEPLTSDRLILRRHHLLACHSIQGQLHGLTCGFWTIDGDYGRLCQFDRTTLLGIVGPIVHENSPVREFSTSAFESKDARASRCRDCLQCPCLFERTINHVIRSQCSDIVRVLHLQSRLDLGGAVPSMAPNLLKVFAAGEITGHQNVSVALLEAAANRILGALTRLALQELEVVL